VGKNVGWRRADRKIKVKKKERGVSGEAEEEGERAA
jgi:hypothetical protein